MPSQRNCVKKLQQAVVVGALSSGTCNYAYAYQKIRQSKKNDNQGGPPHDHDESETTRKPCRGNLRGGKPPCDEDDSARSAHTDEKEAQEDVFDETATGPTAFMVTETGRQEQMPKDKPKPKGKRTSKRNKATAGPTAEPKAERKAEPTAERKAQAPEQEDELLRKEKRHLLIKQLLELEVAKLKLKLKYLYLLPSDEQQRAGLKKQIKQKEEEHGRISLPEKDYQEMTRDAMIEKLALEKRETAQRREAFMKNTQLLGAIREQMGLMESPTEKARATTQIKSLAPSVPKLEELVKSGTEIMSKLEGLLEITPAERM